MLPQSPPWTKYLSWPNRFINLTNTLAAAKPLKPLNKKNPELNNCQEDFFLKTLFVWRLREAISGN